MMSEIALVQKSVLFDISAELKKIPGKPGVYLMKNSAGEIIYVGKAVSLKNRVKQYFQSSQNHSPKVRSMVARIASFEYIVTDSEFEALILECNLIKKNRPKYNIKLNDDKHYPYVKVTVQEEYPRVLVARRVSDDGAKYFGPYLNVHSIYDTIHELRRVFPMKNCKRELPRDIGKDRPCLNYHIGLCLGPCSGRVDQSEYRAAIRDICLFLEGKHDDIVKKIEADMREASEDMRYELAGKLRDKLFALRHIQEKQKVLSTADYDQDVVAYHTDNIDTCVSAFFIRGGKLIGKEQFLFEGSGVPDVPALLSEFVKRFYSEAGFIPKEILLQEPIDDLALIEEMLREKKGEKVSLLVPVRGEKRSIVQFAMKNSEVELVNKREAIRAEEGRIREGLAVLGEILGFGRAGAASAGESAAAGAVSADKNAEKGGADGEGPAVEADPVAVGGDGGGAAESADADSAAADADPGELWTGDRIEAYDVSNYGESDKVASMIVFEGGRPLKAAYRRFLIKGVDGQNDYACMQEALNRRLRHIAEGNSRFAARPDLILVDGGKGHVSAASAVLGELGLNIPLAGMAKDDRHQTSALVTEVGGETPLAPHPELFRLISAIQDEAHRFAIAYTKKLADKRLSLSALDEIRGVGKSRKLALLAYFKSFRNIRAADTEQLAKAPGIDERTARSIYAFFHDEGEKDGV
ncbi:MAG: excinuclease ABC subunit UvrC [Clostridiales bacterium]|jgi:excinuclease ABC subunit C|nr:excinuclease ABC subunit UvrC [Clostridiales bacterium]